MVVNTKLRRNQFGYDMLRASAGQLLMEAFEETWQLAELAAERQEWLVARRVFEIAEELAVWTAEWHEQD
jgi:hypothetical protein